MTHLCINGVYYNLSGIDLRKVKRSLDVRPSSEDLTHRADLWRGDRCSKTDFRQFDTGILQFIMAPSPNPHSEPQTSPLPSTIYRRFSRNFSVSSKKEKINFFGSFFSISTVISLSPWLPDLGILISTVSKAIADVSTDCFLHPGDSGLYTIYAVSTMMDCATAQLSQGSNI